MYKTRTFSLCLLVLLCACSTPQKEDLVDNPLDGEPSFIAIDKETGNDVHSARTNMLQIRGAVGTIAGSTPDDFYLAIHKRELGNKIFM